MSTKKEQRLQIRTRIEEFPLEARVTASTHITRRVLELPEYQSAKTVAFYAALLVEPQTRELFSSTRAAAVFPRTEAELWSLSFHRVHAWGDLVPGKFGVLEPDPAHCPMIDIDTINLILVPGMAFERSGRRLGRGGGFYDRLLEKLPPETKRIGLFFSCQEMSDIIHEPHDQHLDLVVTEAEVIRCRRGR